MLRTKLALSTLSTNKELIILSSFFAEAEGRHPILLCNF